MAAQLTELRGSRKAPAEGRFTGVPTAARRDPVVRPRRHVNYPVPWSGWALSQLHVALGNHDEAFRWLAHRPRHAFIPWARVHPPFAPLWKDPRFAALMAEMRLPNP